MLSLFRLPLLAIDNVLCMLNPFEIINLSLTSSKAKRIVFNFCRIKIRSKLSIRLIIDKYLGIHVYRNGIIWQYEFTSYKANIGRKSDEYGSIIHHKIYIYCENLIEEYMKWCEHIKTVLGCQIKYVHFEMTPFENRSLINWLKSQQETIENLHFVSFNEEVREDNFKSLLKIDKEVRDDIKYFLSNIKVTKRLHLSIQVLDMNGFQFNFPENLDSLCIFDSKIIIYEELLKIKSREICLWNSILTNREINMFLKSWMNMETHLELKSFRTNIAGPEAMDEILDLPHELTHNQEFIKNARREVKADVTHGFNIKRIDGRVATMCRCRQRENWFIYLIIR